MSWPEVITAKAEGRRELVVSGPQISERIQQSGLDPSLFSLATLNYLSITDTFLAQIPPDISRLANLQTLVLHSNKLSEVVPALARLSKLKVLDLSRNALESFPEALAQLDGLTSINVSSNRLTAFPAIKANSKLQVLDLTGNKLKEFPDICHDELVALTDLRLSGNEIESIPVDVRKLAALKNVNLSGNKIKVVPGELADCSKIKELNLKENPISDRRLLKLIDQCRMKQVLDYIKQHCQRSAVPVVAKAGKKGKKRQDSEEKVSESTDGYKYKVKVLGYDENTVRIVLQEDVKKVRGYLLACLVRELEFTADNLKRFIQLQTRLHEGVCEKRNAATIATHDADKMSKGNLTFTALPPKELHIKPLNRLSPMSGEELFARLKHEAENLRKEKKRNVYSGIHKYLYLLEGHKVYPCLLDSNNDVISFPPITNSDITKISMDTKTILVEVTSSTSQQVCEKVLDTFLKETVLLLEHDLVVQQVKTVDAIGNLKSVYPSKNADPVLDRDVIIVRE